MSSFVIETARAADRDELLALLLRAFRVANPKHPPFDSLYPDLFVPTDAAMGCHLVTRENRRITACVGAYPLDLRVGPCSVRTVGIGQVACDPDARGAGRMTALLNAVLAKLPSLGCAISWLSGRRDRYARFGWDLAGTTLKCGMDARSVGTAPAGWRVECLESPSPLPDVVWGLRCSQPIREELPCEAWHLKLRRGQTHVWLARRKGATDATAFAVARADGTSLQEWAGDQDALQAIAAAAVERYGSLSTTFQPGLDAPADALFHTLSVWKSGALSNLRIDSLANTLSAYAPLLRERLPARAGIRLDMTAPNQPVEQVVLGIGGEPLVLDRCAMVRLLFGPTAPSALLNLPARMRWLDQVFPLPFRLPDTSHV